MLNTTILFSVPLCKTEVVLGLRGLITEAEMCPRTSLRNLACCSALCPTTIFTATSCTSFHSPLYTCIRQRTHSDSLSLVQSRDSRAMLDKLLPMQASLYERYSCALHCKKAPTSLPCQEAEAF
jgi:hypothetical protein